MTNGTSTLQYKLFSDAPHANNFNQTGAGTVTGNGTGLPQLITVYGQIVAGQNVSPGAYTDTVTAILTY